MSVYISDSIRNLVAERANYKCEYCKTSERNTFYKFQVDHIISLKHGGNSELLNLAYSCPICNRNKGSDLGTILKDGGPIIPFFNPRVEKWIENFDVLETGEIVGKSDSAKATLKIFGINHPDSLIERAILLQIGLFP